MHTKTPIQHSDRFAFLSLFRIIAALIMAIWGHYGTHFLVGLGLENIFLENSFLRYLFNYGGVFVEMFFIISGLWFYYTYRPRIIKGMSLDSFITRRIIRLYPMIAITSIYMYCGNAFLYFKTGNQWPDGSLSLWNLCCDILFAGRQNFAGLRTLNGVIWFVASLMMCYVVAYMLTLFSSKFNTFIVYAFPIVVAMLLWYHPLDVTTYGTGWSIDTARALESFFCGVFCGRVLEFQKKLTIKQTHILRILLFLELLFVIWTQTRTEMQLLTDNVNLFYTFLVFPELIMLLYDVKWVNKLCSSRIIQLGGAISYSIYMWHFPMYLTFHILITFNILKINVYSFEFLLLRTLALLAIASLSYILIEKKLTGAINRLITQVTKQNADESICL